MFCEESVLSRVNEDNLKENENSQCKKKKGGSNADCVKRRCSVFIVFRHWPQRWFVFVLVRVLTDVLFEGRPECVCQCVCIASTGTHH